MMTIKKIALLAVFVLPISIFAQQHWYYKGGLDLYQTSGGNDVPDLGTRGSVYSSFNSYNQSLDISIPLGK